MTANFHWQSSNLLAGAGSGGDGSNSTAAVAVSSSVLAHIFVFGCSL